MIKLSKVILIVMAVLEAVLPFIIPDKEEAEN